MIRCVSKVRYFWRIVLFLTAVVNIFIQNLIIPPAAMTVIVQDDHLTTGAWATCVLCVFSHSWKRFAGVWIIVVFLFVFIHFLISCVSKVTRLLILAPLKKISWKESKFKTMKRQSASDDGERGKRNCARKLCASCLHLNNLHPHSP